MKGGSGRVKLSEGLEVILEGIQTAKRLLLLKEIGAVEETLDDVEVGLKLIIEDLKERG
mgnify:CR=1 FL=1